MEEKQAFLDEAREKRTQLLKEPVKRQITRKYVQPPHLPGMIYSGVRPGAAKKEQYESWRLDQLSKQIPRLRVKKYAGPPPYKISTVHPTTLTGPPGTWRTPELANQSLRYLKCIKSEYAHLGLKFRLKMDKQILKSWNTIYNWYKRQDYEKYRKKTSRKGKKLAKKMTKEERWKRIKAWCEVKAKPRPKPKRPPRPPRKIADLKKIRANMESLAEPRFTTKKYKRPSLDSQYVNPDAVSEAAKSYVISDRVRKLAQCPESRLQKEPVIIPGKVRKGALKYKASKRVLEIAIPKKTVDAPDGDVKDNPFQISPNALKYKATPRITELAKPIER